MTDLVYLIDKFLSGDITPEDSFEPFSTRDIEEEVPFDYRQDVFVYKYLPKAQCLWDAKEAPILSVWANAQVCRPVKAKRISKVDPYLADMPRRLDAGTKPVRKTS